MITRRARRVPERKRKMLSEFSNLLRENKYLIVVDANKCKATLLNEVRRYQSELRFRLRGGKNSILKLAVKQVYPNSSNLVNENLNGQNVFIFTNEDPFKLSFELGSIQVELPASPGDVATSDIVVREGNTGLPPGPIISLFSSAKIPTKIISGSIHVTKDVIVAREGEVISTDLANLLNKLGIKPIKAKLKFKYAFDLKKNVFIPGELLRPEILAEYQDMIKESVENMFKLSITIGYVTPLNAAYLLSQSIVKAISLALALNYVSKETLPALMSKAVTAAITLSKHLAK